MPAPRFPDDLVDRRAPTTKIVLFVLDGLGGLPHPETGLTELESAHTPALDDLASRSSLGMLIPVSPGVAPGSGPGHLALFGYDPVEYVIGRGALSALGVGFPLQPGDLAARLNLCTLDPEGRIVDRRAGRPSDAEGQRVVRKLRERLRPPPGTDLFVEHEKEHRAVLILRGGGLSPELGDTDPQATGVPPLPPRPLTPEAQATAALVQGILDDMLGILRDEPVVNGVLARGFAAYQGYPGFRERYGLRALAVAQYPMYRGVARLVGMEVREVPTRPEELVDILERRFEEFDFFFLHYKYTDSRGEDGDFQAKVAAIEAADALVARLAALGPGVLVVTGDHSTPAAFRAHSWHSVPLLLHSPWARPTGRRFGEGECRRGDLGTFEAKHLMTLALAHAGRLNKFGA